MKTIYQNRFMYEEEARERADLRDLFNEGVEYARPKRMKLAVDAIMAHNDEQAVPGQKWYINEEVVGDLLGGEASHEKSYLIRRYLLSRRTEITAHHQKHYLQQENNRKLIGIAERMKVEGVGSLIQRYQTDRFEQATDTIIAYNDGVNDYALRWYISSVRSAWWLAHRDEWIPNPLPGGALFSRSVRRDCCSSPKAWIGSR